MAEDIDSPDEVVDEPPEPHSFGERLAHALGVPPAVLLPAPGEEVGEVRRSGPDLLVDITWPGPDEAEETGDPEAERRLIELLREAFPAALRGRGDGSGEPGEDAGR